jgi:peptidoglycan/LPS O-acetylase OafA/YrhL
VVIFHFGLDYYPFNIPPVKSAISHSSFRVSFFFFISGFVMSLVYSASENLSAKEFYFKRASRIVPLYLFGFLITLILLLFMVHASPKGIVIVAHALMLQSFYPGYVLDLNFPSWTISVEIVFYLLFPLLMRGMQNFGNLRLGIFIVVLWLLQSFQHVYFVDHVHSGTKASEEFISAFPLWHLPTFMCGMACALLIRRGQWSAGSVKFVGLAVLLGWLLLALIIRFQNPFVPYIHNGLLVPVFVLIVGGLYYDRSLIHRLMSARMLRSLGDLSYAFFIFQYPVWLVCKQLSTPAWQVQSSFFFFYLGCLIVFSASMHRFVEKPVMVWLRQKYYGREHTIVGSR